MKISKKYVTIEQLSRGFADTITGGVVAYDGKLNVRPAYQREFVYDDKKREAVIQSVLAGCPIGVFNWGKCDDGGWEIIDGQQRSISICQYIAGLYAITYNGKICTVTNLKGSFPDDYKRLMEYELLVYECQGTSAEKLNWFRTINMSGEKLNDQEILNAVYSGLWVSLMREQFSRNDCPAKKIGKDYIKGNPIRQELLAQVLRWCAHKEGLKDVETYMSKHQADISIVEIWNYYCDVLVWARNIFPTVRKGMTDSVEWGILYNKYKDNYYDATKIEEEINKLLLDSEITNKKGIIEYILSNHDTVKQLSLRQFSEAEKMHKYEEQHGECAHCHKHFEYNEMQGDHIVPWSKGGKTTLDNLQMLCCKCNAEKSNK